jgi:hypothetical protein
VGERVGDPRPQWVSLFVLLGVVATAAAVLSFAALRDLALLCGFARSLAWLLPVVVDAGAAAGTLVWLSGRAGDRARRFARRLTFVLLGSSVAGNALSHGLSAYGMRPAWWVVVVVSGVAPAGLYAVVHLTVLCGRVDPPPPEQAVEDEAIPLVSRDDQQEPAPSPTSPPQVLPVGDPAPEDGEAARVAELVAAGAGRRTVARELGLTEHEARKRLAGSRNGTGG